MELFSEPRRADERLRWTSAPYFIMHIAALGVFFVEFSWWMPVLCIALYYVRMFGIIAGYHRYFAHRGFKTGRVFQFVLAFLGAMSSQKGVLWWSGHHRDHHRYSDTPEDIHSPKRGFWWSHMLWFIVPRHDTTPPSQLREFAAFPEIVFLNKYWAIPPAILGVMTAVLGGWGAFFWGFCLSTVLLWHGTFTINSLAHVWGSRRYETTDTSRNNFFLSLLTLGEGWHNNHHFYQSTCCNGFFWYEIDVGYYVLRVLSWFGIVWDLRMPPRWVLEGRQSAHDAPIDSFAALRAQAAEQVARAAAEVAEAWRERAQEVREAAAEVAEAARLKALEFRASANARAEEFRASAHAKKSEVREAATQVAAAARERAAKIKLACAEKSGEAAEAVAHAAEVAARTFAPSEISLH